MKKWWENVRLRCIIEVDFIHRKIINTHVSSPGGPFICTGSDSWNFSFLLMDDVGSSLIALTHSILTNLCIKVWIKHLSSTSPAKHCFCPRVFCRLHEGFFDKWRLERHTFCPVNQWRAGNVFVEHFEECSWPFWFPVFFFRKVCCQFCPSVVART